jgi:hypothetical protein
MRGPGLVVLMIALLAALPSPARAEGHEWGVSIWGLSYHVDRSVGYNEDNWGLGLRYSPRPQWRWLGKNQENRVFLEFDALRNSNRGLVLPLSAGVEIDMATVARCKIFAVGALTVAYYQKPAIDTTEVKFGPVPGVAVGCGRVKVNLIAVLRHSSEPLAALAASLTLGF